MNHTLATILKTKQVQRPDGSGSIPLHSHVSEREGEFLRRLVLNVKPAVSLEIGLAYGISTLFICEEIRQNKFNCRHIVIDPMQNAPGEAWQGIGLNNIREAGFADMVTFIEEPSHLALPSMEREGVKVDFAFIDGWHTFDHTLVDLFLVDKLLKVGGILAVDDAEIPPVHKALRYWATNRHYAVIGSELGLSANYRPSWKRRILAKVLPGRVAAPEIRRQSAELRLVGECVAFKKLGEDNRGWQEHHEF